MDTHSTYTSLATLRNISAELENDMRVKHSEMIALRAAFYSIQGQYKDLQKIITLLEKTQKEQNVR
tara:strand:+ start:415 stop:612 length:198 start_codon:yes stop_codon:yes gene_type:complete